MPTITLDAVKIQTDSTGQRRSRPGSSQVNLVKKPESVRVLTDSDIGGTGHTRSFYLLGLSGYTRSSGKPLSGLLG